MSAEPHPSVVLVPGATVTVSGIYRVEHADVHRSAGECVMVAGMVLPACPVCGPRVLYTLLRSAPSAAEDADLEQGER